MLMQKIITDGFTLVNNDKLLNDADSRTMSFDYTSTAAREAFAARLAEICAEKGLRDHGRQAELGRILKVSQPAVGKWFNGETFPDLDRMVEISEWAGVNLEWLMTGRGPKRSVHPTQQSQFVFEVLPDLDEKASQEVLDFVMYKIERSDSLIAREKLASYSKMMEGVIKDSKKRKAQDGDQ